MKQGLSALLLCMLVGCGGSGEQPEAQQPADNEAQQPAEKVSQQVAQIVPVHSELRLHYADQSTALEFKVYDAQGKPMEEVALSYEVSDETLIAVDSSGTVTSLGGTGNASIVAYWGQVQSPSVQVHSYGFRPDVQLIDDSAVAEVQHQDEQGKIVINTTANIEAKPGELWVNLGETPFLGRVAEQTEQSGEQVVLDAVPLSDAFENLDYQDEVAFELDKEILREAFGEEADIVEDEQGFTITFTATDGQSRAAQQTANAQKTATPAISTQCESSYGEQFSWSGEQRFSVEKKTLRSIIRLRHSHFRAELLGELGLRFHNQFSINGQVDGDFSCHFLTRSFKIPLLNASLLRLISPRVQLAFGVGGAASATADINVVNQLDLSGQLHLGVECGSQCDTLPVTTTLSSRFTHNLNSPDSFATQASVELNGYIMPKLLLRSFSVLDIEFSAQSHLQAANHNYQLKHYLAGGDSPDFAVDADMSVRLGEDLARALTRVSLELGVQDWQEEIYHSALYRGQSLKAREPELLNDRSIQQLAVTTTIDHDESFKPFIDSQAMAGGKLNLAFYTGPALYNEAASLTPFTPDNVAFDTSSSMLEIDINTAALKVEQQQLYTFYQPSFMPGLSFLLSVSELCRDVVIVGDHPDKAFSRSRIKAYEVPDLSSEFYVELEAGTEAVLTRVISEDSTVPVPGWYQIAIDEAGPEQTRYWVWFEGLYLPEQQNCSVSDSYLVNPAGGVSLLRSDAEFTAEPVCYALAGSEVELLGSDSNWQQVRVLSGECRSKTGWVGRESVHSYSQ
ncbi:SH3 domain-containing protein [Pseudoalteromonas rubra]|uniref:SH3 domain-containing protein n=1 Tax=Pseudoalteromonas rubra TaxID=43658 RepID=UPI000F767315|nr:SH3 domain-containing protein [Pseudoalteromonas rubra]